MTLLRPIWVLVIPLLLAGAVGMVGAAAGRDQQALNGNPTPELAQLGQRLFHDVALSRGGTQSCATCHDPEHAFTDPREGAAGRAVSLGDDGMSYGDRNTPTLNYAALSPVFHRDDKGRYKGGQFWDGRADDLEDQAGQPMLNPVEMAMVDKAAVVGRWREDPAYRESFAALFGPDALN
uniref:cytochrome-c peroxidase n=1 Tax=Paracoccus sp. TaxID=267 RepID=UPI0033417CA3